MMKYKTFMSLAACWFIGLSLYNLYEGNIQAGLLLMFTSYLMWMAVVADNLIVAQRNVISRLIAMNEEAAEGLLSAAKQISLYEQSQLELNKTTETLNNTSSIELIGDNHV